MTLDLGTKAYLAGIIDTMGIIRTREMRGDNPPIPYVGLHTPNLQISSLFAGVTDTKVTTVTRKYNKAQCTEHCTPDSHVHVNSVSHRWSVTGVKATVMLHNIKPYLVFKTDEANEALRVGMVANYKPATWRKMQLLGWEIPDLSDQKGKRT